MRSERSLLNRFSGLFGKKEKKIDGGDCLTAGDRLLNERCYEDALACSELGIEIAPHDIHLWSMKGSALLCMHRRREALACFERALAIAVRNDIPEIDRWGCAADWSEFVSDKSSVDGLLSDLWADKGLALLALG